MPGVVLEDKRELRHRIPNILCHLVQREFFLHILTHIVDSGVHQVAVGYALILLMVFSEEVQILVCRQVIVEQNAAVTQVVDVVTV